MAHDPAIRDDIPRTAQGRHQRSTGRPATGQRSSDYAVAGGLNEREIATMSPEQAAAQANDAIDQTGGRHLIVAPGCVIPVATPEATIRAITTADSAR
ncbi:MAG TPA: hypothetical protein VGR16_14370 [Thermomicrobiales bacterium]|nr:hypothetical protein [Thermomicrobiales bacterium]